MELAGTPERWRWLRSELAWLRSQDTDARLLTPEEAVDLVPIIDPTGVLGALYDPLEGTPRSERRHTRLRDRRAPPRRRGDRAQPGPVAPPLPNGEWHVETEQGDDRRRAHRERRRAVGAARRQHGRRRSPARADAASLPRHRRDPGGRGDPGRDGRGHRPRGLHVPAARGQRRAARRLRAEPAPLAGRGRRVGLRSRRCSPRSSTGSCPSCRSGSRASPSWPTPGSRSGSTARSPSPPTGTRSSGRSRASRTTGRRAAAWPGSRRARGSGSRVANWIVDGDPGYDVFGMDVARFGAVRRRTTGICATRPRSSTRAGSSWPTRTRSCRRGGRSRRRRSTTSSSRRARSSRVNWGLEVPLYFAPVAGLRRERHA